MDIKIGFTEIAEYTREELGQEVVLSFIDEKSANVSSVVKTTIPYVNKEVSKEVSVKLSDIRLVGEDLQLHFDAGVMINFLAPIIVKILPDSVVERGIVDFPDNATVVVHLSKVKTGREILRHIEVRSIGFNETAAIINFKLRTI